MDALPLAAHAGLLNACSHGGAGLHSTCQKREWNWEAFSFWLKLSRCLPQRLKNDSLLWTNYPWWEGIWSSLLGGRGTGPLWLLWQVVKNWVTENNTHALFYTLYGFEVQCGSHVGHSQGIRRTVLLLAAPGENPLQTPLASVVSSFHLQKQP